MKTRKCPSGKIRRKSYIRKSYKRKDGKIVKGSKVPSVCIKDMGKPGKGKKLFTLKKGDLVKHGYSLKISVEQRRNALQKSLRNIDNGTLVKKLNALYVLHKNTNLIYAKRARSDMKWIQSKV